MGVENQQQINLPKRESQIDETGMDIWMDGWMDDDGWHSLNPNQNNVLDGLKPGSFDCKVIGAPMGVKPKPKWA
jgi:hypothetical protein